MPVNALLWLVLFATIGASAAGHGTALPESVVLVDQRRDRRIPVAVYPPAPEHGCSRQGACAVAFISPGYGLPHTGYSFLADPLTRAGHLVVAIQHDLPSDPALATAGDLVALRTPAWERGAETLRFVRDTLSDRYPAYDWSRLVLIGHSNGGDLSALALDETPALAKILITLDHRRYPIPRRSSLEVLSIRGSDFEADPGVLPGVEQVEASGHCIVEIAGSRHNDMHDGGPAWLKARIDAIIEAFVRDGRCSAG